MLAPHWLALRALVFRHLQPVESLRGVPLGPNARHWLRGQVRRSEWPRDPNTLNSFVRPSIKLCPNWQARLQVPSPKSISSILWKSCPKKERSILDSGLSLFLRSPTPNFERVCVIKNGPDVLKVIQLYKGKGKCVSEWTRGIPKSF